MDYYDFIAAQWSLNKLTSTQIQNAVAKGYITQDQADVIIGTEKSV